MLLPTVRIRRDMTVASGTRFGSYEVLSPIGAGGMGEVYRARDSRLGRDVAIKVLPERLASDPDSLLRFEHEARAVAALSHPNILSIFDIGRERGVSFAVMELLEGETLRDKLRGPLPARKVAEYAAQIASGLAAAHGRGVVHRDLKPENLFVTRDGHVKILDFGLALFKRASERPLDAAGRGQTAAADHPMARLNQTAIPTDILTEPGTVMGTVGYMSPEQARGWPADHRCDIFSFGAVLYEMLAGERAFRGGSTAEVLTAILRDDPPELPEPSRAASPALERIARRCLEKDPEERFQLARDLAFALEAVGGGPARRPAAQDLQGEGAGEGKRSVAVLFFQDLARDPENAHLGLGLADATITELATVKSLLVRPTSAILRYQDRSVPPEQAGRELGVDAVVAGSFQRAGSRLRVTVQLIDVSDGRSLWGTKIDSTLEDVFRMQDEVSRRIAEALEVELSPAEERRLARVAEAYGRSWEQSFERLDALLGELPAGRAHELYMKGRVHLFSERIEEVNAAIESFEKARDEDPGFALAWVGLSSAYARMGFTFDPDGNWLERAEAMCERALAIDPRLPEGRYLRGLLAWTPRRGFDHAEAMREFLAAIAGRPSLTEAHERLGVVLLHVAMPEEAARHIGEARQINPEDTLAQIHLGWCRYLEGRYPEALEVSLAAHVEKESFWSNYQVALCHLRLGDLDAAEQSIELGSRRFPGDPLACSARAVIAARRGNAALAREQIDLTLRNRRSFGHYHHAQYDVACALALLGDTKPALDWLTAAARDGFPCHLFFERDAYLDAIRGERFDALMGELKTECDGYRRLYRELAASGGSDSGG